MKKIFSLIFLCFLLSPMVVVFAQAPTPYKLLAPIPLPKSGCKGDPNEVCTTTPGPYIEDIFVLIIQIATGLAVVVLIYGGIKYISTDAIGGKSEAKDIIQNALWGLLLVISAWLILDTINPKLVNFNLTIPVQTTQSAPSTPGTPGGAPPGGTPITGLAGEPLTQEQAKSALIAGNIGINGNPTLEGLRQGVIDELIALKKACGCNVTVNDATGGGHDTVNEPVCNHQNGYKVDTDVNSALNNFITQNYQPAGQWSNGTPLYKSPSGAIYAFEKNHWDVARC